MADRSKDYDWGSDVQTQRSQFTIPSEKDNASASGGNSGSNQGGNSGGNSNTDPNTPTEDIPGEDRP